VNGFGTLTARDGCYFVTVTADYESGIGGGGGEAVLRSCKNWKVEVQTAFKKANGTES
jgi:hypothetical protein